MHFCVCTLSVNYITFMLLCTYQRPSRGIDPGTYDIRLNQTMFREIEQDNCFIIQQIDNKTRNILKSFCRHFFTSLFLPTYEATYIAGYLLPTDDIYREHHDHIWIVLHFVE